MSHHRPLSAVLTVSAVVGFAPAALAVPFNGSFEDDFLGDTSPEQWELRTVGSGTTTGTVVDTNVTDGSLALQLTIPQGNDFGTFFTQFRSGTDLANAGLVEGEDYFFEFDITIESSGELGVNTFFEVDMFVSDFASGGVSPIAGSGTVSQPFTFASSSLDYGFGVRGGVYEPTAIVATVDNFRVVPVPEPATGLLALSGLALAGMRRRRA